MLKITIQDGRFTHEIDYSIFNTIDGGFEKEYFPKPKEAIEDFLRMLENIYDGEQIADALAEGLDAMEYSEKGWAAKRLLEKGKDNSQSE